MRFRSSEAVCLVVLTLIALANGLLWMFSIPFNEAPDEAAHFQVVRFIRDHGRLPVFSPDELWLISTAKGAVETYATFPPLAYFAAALASLPFANEPLWGARLVSVASYVATVVLTFAIARTLLADLRIAVSAALIVAFLPQFAFAGAYVNNDALAVFESGVLYYLLVRLYQRRGFPRSVGEGLVSSRPDEWRFAAAWLWRQFSRPVGRGLVPRRSIGPADRWSGRGQAPPLRENDEEPSAAIEAPRGRAGLIALASIGLVIGALLLTKYTFYAAAGVGFVAALVAVRRPVQLVALVGGVAASAGWWFLRNYQLYGEAMPSTVIAEAKAAAGGNILFVPSEYGIDLLSLSTRTDFWWATFTSFVGKFGWLTIELAPAYYLGCLAFAGLALIGIGVLFVDGARRSRGGWGVDLGAVAGHHSGLVVVLIGGAVITATTLAAMATNAYGEYSPQGRYLFAGLIPIAIGLAAGWSGIAALASWLRIVPIAATLAIIALNFVSLFGYVVPTHFSGAERIIIQVDPAPAGPAGAVEVMGWSLREGVSSWRAYAPGAVRDYRVPVHEITAYVWAPPPSGRALGVEYGLERPDVADFFGGFSGIERVGYRLHLPWDKQAPDGSIPVYICATGSNAGRECREATAAR